MSPDAARIMMLPQVHHPRMKAAVHMLASNAKLTLPEAATMLDALQKDLKLSDLDVEMAAPGAAPVVPFKGTPTEPADERKDAINRHVVALIEQRRRT